MIESGDLLSIGLRVLAFCSFIGFLPSRVLPISARFAIAFALLVFLLPTLGANVDLTSMIFLQGGNYSTAFDLTYSQIVSEIAIGLVLAISVSVSSYVAVCLGLWVSASMGLSSCDENDFSTVDTNLIHPLIAILYLVALFSVQGVTEAAAYLGESFVLPTDVLSASIGGNASITSYLANFLNLVFSVTILLAMPFFFVALLIDVFVAVLKRFCDYMLDESFSRMARIPLLVLVFSVSVFSIRGDFSRFLLDSFTVTSKHNALKLSRTELDYRTAESVIPSRVK